MIQRKIFLVSYQIRIYNTAPIIYKMTASVTLGGREREIDNTKTKPEQKEEDKSKQE